MEYTILFMVIFFVGKILVDVFSEDLVSWYFKRKNKKKTIHKKIKDRY